ncbi:MAG: hypothetical protein K0R10_1769 [Alphaproteobacteria bacterium]|nr:hypothetical protein [Alphaproteobacteria bacterium]
MIAYDLLNAGPAPSSYVSRYAGGSSPSFFNAAPTNVLTFSVIYPGVIVLLTMLAYYFLRVLEPNTTHAHPSFIRSALVLAALWMVGFYPFLQSALGGFLFCASAIACIAAWLIIRRFGLAGRPVEQLVVFWSFFFFSILLAAMVTGNGGALSGFFARAASLMQDITRAAFPLLLVAIHVGAVWLVMRLLGWKLPRTASPQSIVVLKILGLALAIFVLDFIVIGLRFRAASWASWPLYALPSLAYYGVYWLVMRLPEPLRGRVTLALFGALAVFLALLACLQSGVSGAMMLLGATAVGIAASIGGGIYLLWKSDAEQHVKVSLTITFGLFLLCLVMLSR